LNKRGKKNNSSNPESHEKAIEKQKKRCKELKVGVKGWGKEIYGKKAKKGKKGPSPEKTANENTKGQQRRTPRPGAHKEKRFGNKKFIWDVAQEKAYQKPNIPT